MLSPSIQLQIGALTYGPQIAALRVRRIRLPAVDRLDVVLPTGVRLDATPGDDVTLELDGGEGSDTVFTGRVAEIRRRFDTVTVTARGGADRLARARPSLALDRITAGSAIIRIAAAAEVQTGEIADGPSLAIYAADGRATALAEVARLAAFSGASAHFDGAGRLSVPDPEQPAEPLALRYGREILAAESSEGDVSGPVPHVVGEGGDPAGPQARWVLADFDRGGAGPADARRIAIPEIRTKRDADKAGAALAAARAARAKSVRLTTFLLPALAPSLPLQLADMPGGVPLSRATVHQVVHTIRPDGAAISEIWGTGFSSEDGLLGSLLGAVGGLL
jgi:hypothetical protein